MTDQMLKPTVKLTVGEGDSAEEFVLRVPSPLERARIGVREAAIRRSIDPMADSMSLDAEIFFLIKGMAILEALLDKANVTWPFSETKNDKGEPTLSVDITKFPPGKEHVIEGVGLQFEEALDRFHREGTGHAHAAVPKAVDGGVDPGSL